jgi:hypothetical protein
MVVYGILKHALMITVFVFVMMLIVDFLDMFSKKRLTALMKGGKWRQYAVASFLGATPGCLGAFMDVSLYVHGLISFGALTGAMIATSGDEAFVMLVTCPGTALLLFGLLFILSIPLAWVTDGIVRTTGYDLCESCKLHEYHAEEGIYPLNWKGLIENLADLSAARHTLIFAFGFFAVAILSGIAGFQSWGWKSVTSLILLSLGLITVIAASDHYLKDHIWSHIIRTHIWRVFLWTFFALLVVHLGLAYWNFRSLISGNIPWMFLFGALLGVIPESGPHLVFVMLFAEGVIPFSVLFTSSFVQDGHGMLPLLSYTIRDSILIKILNLAFGLSVGMLLYIAGW